MTVSITTQPTSTIDQSAGTDSQEADLGPALARVVHSQGCELTLSGSHMTPSRPGFAGDRGTVEGIAVIDVDEREDGLLHVLESPLPREHGQLVEVSIDRDRRDRLARTHGACALVRALLEDRSASVTSTDITAGMAWMEIDEVTPAIELGSVAALAIPLRSKPLPSGRMLVTCGGVSVMTTIAPIATNTQQLEGADVRTVSVDVDGRSVLEITLPDAEGRWWK
ncbi:MAG TPA: hypothetical protein VFF79_02570 [Conexibacter sp.]|nr:hypothetical protein [Conexibacter sp.]